MKFSMYMRLIYQSVEFSKSLKTLIISKSFWQPPTFPSRLQLSIIGRLSLNHRVRDVDGCFP